MLRLVGKIAPLTVVVFTSSVLSVSLVNRWAYGRISPHHIAALFSASAISSIFAICRYSMVKYQEKSDQTWKVCSVSIHQVIQHLQIIMCCADMINQQQRIKDEVRTIVVLLKEPMISIVHDVVNHKGNIREMQSIPGLAWTAKSQRDSSKHAS